MADNSGGDAFLVNALTIGNQFGPNPFSKFRGPLPIPGYQGAATDPRGVNVSGPPGSSYLDLLSNPQKYNPGSLPSQGAQAPAVPQPMSVLDQFLTHSSPGKGPGNQAFFDTLNAMRASPGGTSSGGGNVAAPIYAQAPPPATIFPAAPAGGQSAAPAPAAPAPAAGPGTPQSTDALASSYYTALGAPPASTDPASQLQAASRALQAQQYSTPYGTSINSMPFTPPGGAMNMQQYQHMLAAASPQGGPTNPYQLALLRSLYSNQPPSVGVPGGNSGASGY